MEKSQSIDDELDLLAMILILWDQRMLIASSTIAILGASLLFVQTQAPIYRGELEIHSLDELDIARFAAWNETVDVVEASSQQSYMQLESALPQPPKSFLQLPRVTVKLLDNQFRAEFVRSTALKEALLEHSAAVQTFDGDEKELNKLINLLRSDFTLFEDQEGKRLITTQSTDKDETTRILQEALASISANAKQNILTSIRLSLDAHNLSLQYALKSIDAEFDALELLYSARKKRSLAFMREQASVARELGLNRPFMVTSFADEKNNVISSEWQKLGPFESSYFLQGYEAIEEQISNIQSREDVENGLFVEGIDALIINRALLEAQNVEKALTPLLNKTPLTEPDFKIVRADINDLKFEKLSNNTPTVLIPTILGILLSVLYVLTKHVIKNRIKTLASP